MAYRHCDRECFKKNFHSSMPIGNLWKINDKFLSAEKALEYINIKLQALKLPPWKESVDNGIDFLKKLGIINLKEKT